MQRSDGIYSELGKTRISITTKILSLFNKKLSVLDVATGHGKFAITARDLGFNVTAVDVRNDRVPINTPGINWEICNILDFNTDPYELILCFGILYHFNNPQKLIDKLKHSPTIYDTHYALEEEVEHLGMKGKFYKESKNITTSSFDDDVSFWPTKEELIKLFQSNYNIVGEVKQYMNNRSFFICIP